MYRRDFQIPRSWYVPFASFTFLAIPSPHVFNFLFLFKFYNPTHPHINTPFYLPSSLKYHHYSYSSFFHKI